jgi:hypothetical protein
VAANKVLEYRRWATELGLFAAVDFTEIDQFSAADIRDLRNMLEHVIEYFQGGGRVRERWMVETPEYRSDATGTNGTVLGGRLDWAAFGAAASRLLPRLLAEPMPGTKTAR